MNDCDAMKKALAAVLGQDCNALGELESESNSLKEEFQRCVAFQLTRFSICFHNCFSRRNLFGWHIRFIRLRTK